jgi:DNA uptake protein ComE-like DNA-binding protein
MEPKKPSRLPLIFAAAALIFLLSALIIQQTVKGNRERVEIIEKSQNPKTLKSETLSPTSPEEQVLGETEEVGQISVNDAIFEELDAIPGVGPKTAEKIIDGRPWENLEDVLNLISTRWREEARGMLKL